MRVSLVPSCLAGRAAARRGIDRHLTVAHRPAGAQWVDDLVRVTARGNGMRAAGIRDYSDPVEPLDLPDPGGLRSDEVLVEVRCCGVGNWDDIARTGGWDLGRQPPMALGVEAAGVIARTGAVADDRRADDRTAGDHATGDHATGDHATGDHATGGPARGGLAVGDRVMTHSLPLRGQGAWAEWFVAAAADVAAVPDTVPFDVAAALPVPGLVADQALGAGPGATLLVHGASGVTGMLLVQLAAGLGAEVIATASQDAAARVTAAGAAHVLDRRAPDWPGQVRRLTAGQGVDLAVNAAPGGAADAITAVRECGRLVTITSDPPAADRGIEVRQVYVAPDGTRLARLGELLAARKIRVTVGPAYRLDDAERALGRVRRGSGGQAVVLQVAS
jgi:NADPH:quinone reductase-like Zn-dependent oxidoreductase